MPTVAKKPETCHQCGGDQFWDNRADKLKPTSPDFKCKAKGCGEAYWLGEEKQPPKRPDVPDDQADHPFYATTTPLSTTTRTLGQLAEDYRDCLTQAVMMDAEILGLRGGTSTIANIADALFVALRPVTGWSER